MQMLLDDFTWGVPGARCAANVAALLASHVSMKKKSRALMESPSNRHKNLLVNTPFAWTSFNFAYGSLGHAFYVSSSSIDGSNECGGVIRVALGLASLSSVGVM